MQDQGGSGPVLHLFTNGGGDSDSIALAAYGTEYTVRIYNPEDEGTTGISWCVDTSLQGTVVGGGDMDADTVFFGSNVGDLTDTGTIRIDSFIQSTSAADVGWAGCS